MADLLSALGLVLVLEGAAYALFPAQMQRMMERAVQLSPNLLRNFGLGAALVGLVLVWLVRS
jgi:uncharacterized protein YjeT (DUF2065 family)